MVYLTASRQTHLLSAPAGWVLQVLENGATHMQALEAHLQRSLGDIGSEDVASLTREIVDTLVKIEIVQAIGVLS